MAKLHFITSGNLLIEAQGLSFGKHIKDPKNNVKNYLVNKNQIILNANDMKDFTDWGIIELNDLNPDKGFLTVMIDSETWGWFGTVQIAIEIKGQIFINDNFQSGVRGPVGDPRVIKKYAIGNLD
ncbi:MAG: hypothetical protein U0354_07720 [Candidatus Sericytochromatia bacterium]